MHAAPSRGDARQREKQTKMSPAGLETRDVSGIPANELGESPARRAAEAGAFSSDSAVGEADLALVVERWATLSTADRERIVAIVRGNV